MTYKLICINPGREFVEPEALRGLVDCDITLDLNFPLFHAPKVGIVVDDFNNLHTFATMYLASISINERSKQGDTVRTYGESLIRWINYLLERNINLEDATEFDAQIYRNLLCQGTQENGRPYSDNTVSIRSSTPLRFHSWALRHNAFRSPLGEWAVRTSDIDRRPWFARDTRQTSRFLPTVIQRIPRILTVNELRALFKCVGKPYSLLFRWAVVTGLRRFELCNLSRQVLPTLSKVEVNASRLIQFPIVRKGGKSRTVYAPPSLLEETHWYLIAERPSPKPGFEDYVFLTSSGRAIEKSRLSRIFRAAANEIGSDATLHHLRHTYAVTVLKILEGRAEGGEPINPLKTLQILMGHSSIETTEIYLRALDMQSDAVEEALDFLYGAAQ